MRKLSLYCFSLFFLIIGSSCISSPSGRSSFVTEIQQEEKAVIGDIKPRPTVGPENKPAEPVKDTRKTEVEENATFQGGLEITAEPEKCEIYIEDKYIGQTPLFIPYPNLPDGEFLVELKKDGYYSVKERFTIAKTEKVVFKTTLLEITGYLSLSIAQDEATIYLSGVPVSEGITELPIGKYTLLIKKFGFETFNTSIEIAEKETLIKDISLIKAPMRIENLQSSRLIFNPENPGATGWTEISFSVSTHGTGDIYIYDEDNRKVFQYNLSSFTTWDQLFVWYGQDSKGNSLPDGKYRIKIQVKGTEEESYIIEDSYISIDSSLIIQYRSQWSGLSGLVFSPTTEVLPASNFQFAQGLSHFSAPRENNTSQTVTRMPLNTALRFGMGNNLELDISLLMIFYMGAIQSSSNSNSFHTTAGIKYRFLGEKKDGVSAAITGKAVYSSYFSTLKVPPLDYFANFTGVTLGLPFQYAFGPLVITASPEITVSPYKPGYNPNSDLPGFNTWLYGKGGLLFDTGNLSLGISGALRTAPLNEGFSLSLPVLTAFECNLLLPGSSFYISGYSIGTFYSLSNYYLQWGVNFGVVN